MLDYKDVHNEIVTGDRNNLLLGSGFSIAFSKKLCFDEKKYLIDSESDEEKQKHFRQKNDAILTQKNENAHMSGRTIQVDTKKTIVEELSKFHPKGICEISQEEANHCFEFLNPFLRGGKVFTLNYDLMLYWASVRALESSNELYKDGFESLNSTRNGWAWKDDDSINVYYCHGALNLYVSNSKCYKSAHDQLCFLPLKQRIENHTLPLYVSKLTSKEKLDDIYKNNYLSSCLRELNNISGTLVVFGFAANKNDEHILNAIRNSQEKNNLKVFFGLHTSGNDWEEVKKRVENSGLKVAFYNSSDVHIWR